jgi:hypothetical protein
MRQLSDQARLSHHAVPLSILFVKVHVKYVLHYYYYYYYSSPEPQDKFNILKCITDSLTLRQVMKKTKLSLL